MIAELAALAALYKPHMSCVVSAPHQSAVRFSSDTTPTPDGGLLVQRNYLPGFSEIIVYAYDAKNRRYSRTQLTREGKYSAATSEGPVKGVWTWTNVPAAGVATIPVRHFSVSSGVLRYSDNSGATSECR